MNATYTRLTEGFRQWLHIIGYTEQTTKQLPKRIAELFTNLESQGVYQLSEVQKSHLQNWYAYQKTRKNPNTGELLKNHTLNSINSTWRLFGQYLHETDQGTMPVDIPYETVIYEEREVLTAQQVQTLYNATDETMLGLLDRAMLSVYYGCGLRSNEGINLDISDVLLDKGLLYVRKGKGYKERYVPFTGGVKTDFKLYLQECRPKLAKDTSEQAFLLNSKGRRIGYATLIRRLRILTERANIEKPIGLHIFRHSIATHLLQSGMKIEDIAKFLGHAYLSSTQIYTHLIHEHGAF
jgi:integrase/recombinase XerD